ncbi:carbohydrate ABC transporter permease [Vallitalea maricola]|uniref:Sugar ABC transporter permease n=1 Tax=Vallitalea maricola TaxID=3074433 RepID=A0ACB5UGF2_9FIRM|nr:sugar ABC transporter permease [Vallitalea sp. AN17-2]
MSNRKKSIRRNRLKGYAFLLPNIIGFAIFTFLPVVVSMVLSFTDWDGFGELNFIGFKNYMNLFSDSTFQISLWNNIYFTAISVPVTMILALLVAVALNKGIKGIKIYRMAFFLPYITAALAVAVVWQLLYHPSMGPINGFLRSIGIDNPPRWLSSTKWAMTSVIIMYIWKMIGYYMIIFLAGLQGIPKNLYEAANIDGANSWHKFRKVTVPMLSPVIFFAVIIGVINSFKVFTEIYALTEGGPGRSTNVLVYNIYVEAFQKYNLGYASAMAYVLFAIIVLITLIQFRGQKKWVNY